MSRFARPSHSCKCVISFLGAPGRSLLSLLCSGRGGMDRAAVWTILEALREPSEDSDLCSLSSSLQQLTSSDGEYPRLSPPCVWMGTVVLKVIVGMALFQSEPCAAVTYCTVLQTVHVCIMR